MEYDDFRNVMRTFGTGLSVVTAYDGNEPVGFTCQALMSVSLDPPLVALCASRDSTTWPRIRTAKRFAVNILAASQAAVSRVFATSGPGKFRGIAWYESSGGLPWLTGSLGHLDCDVDAEHDAGDHTVTLGRVRHADAAAHAQPLVYYQSRYCTVTSTETDDLE